MKFYDRWVPSLIFDLVMRQRQLQKYRCEVALTQDRRRALAAVGRLLLFSKPYALA